jgi:TetR/AcrR family transcriptional regulator, tetracycline repressor protein
MAPELSRVHPATATVGLSKEDVVSAALSIVERDGAAALSMRRVAEELGAAVTAIYWHVGNRDTLVELLIERLLDEMGDVHASGDQPRQRVAGLAHELRRRLLARPHLIALADQHGMTAAMFQPMQAALAQELAAIGITGEQAGRSIQILQCHVVASVVLARAVARSQTHQGTNPRVWEGTPTDAELVEALATELDLDGAFSLGLDALLDRLLPMGAAVR